MVLDCVDNFEIPFVCHWWAEAGECVTNAEFMWRKCRLSCGCYPANMSESIVSRSTTPTTDVSTVGPSDSSTSGQQQVMNTFTQESQNTTNIIGQPDVKDSTVHYTGSVTASQSTHSTVNYRTASRDQTEPSTIINDLNDVSAHRSKDNLNQLTTSIPLHSTGVAESRKRRSLRQLVLQRYYTDTD